MFILEMTVVIKADDKLALEAIQAGINSFVDTAASGFEIESVSMPILPKAKYEEISALVNRGLMTKKEATYLGGEA
jgi:hypothetical protein